MTPSQPRVRNARLYCPFLLSLLVALAIPRMVLAEKIIAKSDDWEVYTDGRVAGFLSYVHGDASPVSAGIWVIPAEPHNDSSPGTVDMMRIRSGFLGNQLGFGVRGQVTPWTTVTGYVQMWAFIESENRDKSYPNYPDVRQGYAKLEGSWGSFLAGRTRTLFSRGATDIDVLYGHKWGVGFPNKVDRTGPTQGMVGFGVMGSGFAAGMIYGTPVFGGLQLNVGIFDPASVGGPGWNGTRWVRPESELTFERRFGETGKIVLFTNGTYQKVYKPGQCDPAQQLCDETVIGIGYGGRFEAGPFHLGMAGHYGKGLGMSYALENSYAAADAENRLRWSDGYYVQAQVVARQFDFFGGWGISRLFLTDLDKNTSGISVLKHQMGINAGVVYHMTPNVHWDLEYFRAEAAWFLGEKQVLHTGSFGVTFNW